MDQVTQLGERRTTVDDIFDLLHEEILSLRLRPGDKISEADIAARFGVSRQPVRDAFSRLANLDLLLIRPQRATEVKRFSMKEIVKSRFVRAAVEREVLRHAAAQCDTAGAARLDEALARQDRAIFERDVEGFGTLDYEFHKTLCEIAGIEKPADRAIDGTSFLPLLAGKPIRRKTPLYWHFYATSGKPKVAMRMGEWKILAHLDAPEISKRVDLTELDQKTLKTAKLGKLELYNLRADPGETLDLATSETERLKKMGRRLHEIYASVQKDCPTWPDWEWARYEHERIQWPPYRGKRKVELRIPKIPPPTNFK